MPQPPLGIQLKMSWVILTSNWLSRRWNEVEGKREWCWMAIWLELNMALREGSASVYLWKGTTIMRNSWLTIADAWTIMRNSILWDRVGVALSMKLDHLHFHTMLHWWSMLFPTRSGSLKNHQIQLLALPTILSLSSGSYNTPSILVLPLSTQVNLLLSL